MDYGLALNRSPINRKLFTPCICSLDIVILLFDVLCPMLLQKLLSEFEVKDVSFSVEEEQLYDSFFEYMPLKKNAFLIREGEVEMNSYFVYNGILRCWVMDQNGGEQTFWFCKAGTFSMSNISFTLGEKTTFHVQALVDCEIYRIRKEDIDNLYAAIPGLKPLFDNLTARLLDRLLHRQVALIKYKPEEYYLELMATFGPAIHLIPLKDIASFLGITPQALSRIRKRIF